jgi:hypothetical protein
VVEFTKELCAVILKGGRQWELDILENDIRAVFLVI